MTSTSLLEPEISLLVEVIAERSVIVEVSTEILYSVEVVE